MFKLITSAHAASTNSVRLLLIKHSDGKGVVMVDVRAPGGNVSQSERPLKLNLSSTKKIVQFGCLTDLVELERTIC